MANTQEIQAVIDNFVVQLTKAVQQQTLTTLQEALGGASGPARKGPAARAAQSRAPSTKEVRPKGAKRSPEELEQLTAALAKYVKAHAGQRIEEIAVGMETSTKELALPVRKLIAEKALKTKGQKRSTKYFPA